MSRRQDIGVGCLLVVSLVAAAALATFTGAFQGGWRTIDLRVPAQDVAGLQQGADVAVVGIRVGKVDRLELEHDRAWIHVRLDEDQQLRQGTTALVRARSVLGEKYLELVPGPLDAPLLVDGDELPPIGPQIEIDELVTALGPLVDAVDPEVVRQLAGALADAVRDDPERVGRWLHDLETLLDRSAEAAEELPALATEGRATLAAARRTLGLVDARAIEAEETLARADRVLAKLEAGTTDLPETVDEARAAVEAVRELVRTLGGSTDELDRILKNFAEIDRAELERLLRDEGVRIRFAKRKDR